MTSTMNNRPLPEALSRRDEQPVGEWNVNDCAPVRGIPVTGVRDKIMIAPYHDDKIAKAIRAHEMVHAKVSPADLTPWIVRNFSSVDSLKSCEEYRVNYLASKAGFDMNAIVDGSEQASGERTVALNDWGMAVRTTVAYLGTGSHKKYLAGIRKHNKVWANILSSVGRRMASEAKACDKNGTLASTYLDKTTGLPVGFFFSERMGEWLDRLAGSPPDDKPDDEGRDGGSTDGDSPPDDKGSDSSDTDEKSDEVTKPTPKKPVVMLPDVSSGRCPDFMTLAVKHLPLPVIVSGALGKKRVPANSGKHPRRLHRYLTDPQKRVFDRTTKGKGGVIVVDGSGSMSLDRDELRRLVEGSKGATVMLYSVGADDGAENPLDKGSWECDGNGVPYLSNAWVLADKGRMVTDVPFSHGSANGVDLPALKWAVSNRRHSSAPIVWVCDGYVTGIGDEPHELLSLACFRFVKQHNIVIVPDIAEALVALAKLGRGEKVRSNYGHLTRRLEGLVSSDLIE